MRNSGFSVARMIPIQPNRRSFAFAAIDFEYASACHKIKSPGFSQAKVTQILKDFVV